MLVVFKMVKKVVRRKCNRFSFLMFSLFATITTCLFYFNSVNPIHFVNQLLEALTTDELFPYTNLQDDRWLLRTSACFIERNDPWDVMTKRYFQRQPAIGCPVNDEDVLVVFNHDDGYLRVNGSARQLITNGKPRAFKCRKWKIWRNLIEEDDDIYRVSKEFLEFENATLMNHEYALVECYVDNQRIYHNYFYRVLKKADVETNCQANHRLFLQKNPQCLENERLSVLVMGVSGVSKSHFLRQFPQTFDLLANESSVLDFQGYTRVGSDAFECLIPYLIGNSTGELEKQCWGGGSKMFDNCPHLFDSLEKAGYRTAFVENGISASNNGRKFGCKKRVAQYYSRTLYAPVSKFVSNYRNGCWGGKSDDEQVLEWAFRFQKEFYDTPHFGHFWLSRFAEAAESSDTTSLDQELSEVIQRMRGWLNNTVLVLIGDHGQRYGAYRETEEGRVEENLPFLFIKFPDWFQAAYPAAAKNVYNNRFRLITAFDVHHTLRAIIQCQYPKPNSIDNSNAKMEEMGKKRGLSLFEHISQNRTCADAGVSDTFCGCKQNVRAVYPASPVNSHLANTLVRFLNDLTERKRYVCAQFHLKAVIYVKRILSNASKSKSSSTRNKYIVAVALVPGNVKIEATVFHHKNNDSVIVQPDVRRINRENSFANCIKSDDSLLKLICHCI